MTTETQTPERDWADEIELEIADAYASHGVILAADADGMIAAAIRKIASDKEAEFVQRKRKAYAEGMREAVKLACENGISRGNIEYLARRIEKGEAWGQK